MECVTGSWEVPLLLTEELVHRLYWSTVEAAKFEEGAWYMPWRRSINEYRAYKWCDAYLRPHYDGRLFEGWVGNNMGRDVCVGLDPTPQNLIKIALAVLRDGKQVTITHFISEVMDDKGRVFPHKILREAPGQ